MTEKPLVGLAARTVAASTAVAVVLAGVPALSVVVEGPRQIETEVNAETAYASVEPVVPGVARAWLGWASQQQ